MSKVLILLLGTIFGFKSYACIDISGSYKELNSKDTTIFEYTQKGCESLTFKRYDGVLASPEYQEEWKTNGFPTEISSSEEPNIIYSYRFHYIGKYLVYEVTSFDKATGHFKSHSQQVYSLDSSGRLYTDHIFYNYDGTILDSFSYIYQKK